MSALLDPLPGNLLLVIAPHAGGPLMLELLAHLAGRSSLRVLDGGNRFNALALARALRRETADLDAALQRVQLARAFTCYQMAALLAETAAHPQPTIVLDLLSTFYDESVPAPESLRLLQESIANLHRLNRSAPVAISAKPGLQGARPELLETLQSAAGQVWILEPHTPQPPPRLF